MHTVKVGDSFLLRNGDDRLVYAMAVTGPTAYTQGFPTPDNYQFREPYFIEFVVPPSNGATTLIRGKLPLSAVHPVPGPYMYLPVKNVILYNNKKYVPTPNGNYLAQVVVTEDEDTPRVNRKRSIAPEGYCEHR